MGGEEKRGRFHALIHFISPARLKGILDRYLKGRRQIGGGEGGGLSPPPWRIERTKKREKELQGVWQFLIEIWGVIEDSRFSIWKLKTEKEFIIWMYNNKKKISKKSAWHKGVGNIINGGVQPPSPRLKCLVRSKRRFIV